MGGINSGPRARGTWTYADPETIANWPTRSSVELDQLRKRLDLPDVYVEARRYYLQDPSRARMAPVAAWTNALLASPWRGMAEHVTAIEDIYHHVSPDSLAIGAMALKRSVYVKDVHRLADYGDVLSCVRLMIGPVVLGGRWTQGMTKPSLDGTMDRTGREVGGHAVAIIGVSDNRKAVRIVDNRGPSWGQGGRAWMPWEILNEMLAHEAAEAFVVEPDSAERT